MKKIILITFALLCFTKCQAPTSTIVVENKSNYPATLKMEHIMENEKSVILQPTESRTFSLIAPNTIKNAISLKSISRNYLKFISNNHCVVENKAPEVYTIINTTKFNVALTEKNNMFDKTTIDGISASASETVKSKSIDVYSSNLNIQAISDDEFKISFNVLIQNKKIIIKL